MKNTPQTKKITQNQTKQQQQKPAKEGWMHRKKKKGSNREGDNYTLIECSSK